MDNSDIDDVRPVEIRTASYTLLGDLGLPDNATGLVLFAHGSGSSRLSPRNRFVAQQLREGGLATLLFDLLTAQEEEVDRITRHLRFDIDMLARRLVAATDWVLQQETVEGLNIGYFGASTGAAAALIAASERPQKVEAVVSRGGRPDLAQRVLPKVTQPALLIVGGSDVPVIGMNEDALAQMSVDESKLEIIPGATHLFQEPGALEEVARLAREWFQRYL